MRVHILNYAYFYLMAGHHAVYKFQAYANSEKERWIESFKQVLENLRQQKVQLNSDS